MGVDEGAVAGAQEDAAVADDGAGRDAPGDGEQGREAAEDGGVVAAEAVPGAEVAAESRLNQNIQHNLTSLPPIPSKSEEIARKPPSS